MNGKFHELYSDILRWCGPKDFVFFIDPKGWKNAIEIPTLTPLLQRHRTEFFDHDEAPHNAWLGVSVENIKYGLPRIDALRNVPVKTRFLSVEPLLEDIGKVNLQGIHWVIVGGESGPKARPMKQEWVINIQRQCKQQKVAFFFKQWGGWGADGKKRAKKQNGRILSGKTWDQMPELTTA